MRGIKFIGPNTTNDNPQQKISKRAFYLRVVLGIFAALVVIAVAIVAIMGIVYSSNANALHRYCVEARGLNSTAVLRGAISMDINDRDIRWKLQHTPDLGPVLALHIMGPIPFGIEDGPLDFALCGSPSSLSCDLTVPNYLEGHITELNPGGTGLKSIIQAIRSEPWRYYLSVNTGTFPGGELRAGLNAICGSE